MTAAFHEEAMKLVPMRRPGRPEEVAAAVSFLCADDPATSPSGESVNGGMI